MRTPRHRHARCDARDLGRLHRAGLRDADRAVGASAHHGRDGRRHRARPGVHRQGIRRADRRDPGGSGQAFRPGGFRAHRRDPGPVRRPFPLLAPRSDLADKQPFFRVNQQIYSLAVVGISSIEYSPSVVSVLQDLSVAIVVAFGLLALATLVDWIRHRDEQRTYLVLALVFLALVVLIGPNADTIGPD